MKTTQNTIKYRLPVKITALVTSIVLLLSICSSGAYAEVPKYNLPDYDEIAGKLMTFDEETWEIRPVEDRLYPDGIITPLEMDMDERIEIVKELCLEYAPNDYIAYGMLAMCIRESKCKSYAVAGQRAFSQEFTDYVSSGFEDGSTRDYYIYHCKNVSGGYGLAQWSSYTLNFNFYEFARAWGTSIGDAEMQVAFIIESSKHTNLGDLWSYLEKCKSPYEAGLQFGMKYDVASAPDYVGQLAQQQYYNDFGKWK